jgi:hypothetical protein
MEICSEGSKVITGDRQTRTEPKVKCVKNEGPFMAKSNYLLGSVSVAEKHSYSKCLILDFTQVLQSNILISVGGI